MTSQYQYFAFAWRHRSIVVTSQCSVRKGRPWQQWRNERSMIVLSGFVCSWHKIACKKWNNTFVTVNNDFLSLMRRFGNDFHSWLRHSWKSLPNRFTRDKKIVIHGNSCIILYLFVKCAHLHPGYAANLVARSRYYYCHWTVLSHVLS